ncbi:MAG: RNB domain-containing ribonuclease, partial [Planctomycetes bacterium]|nr:RNB domain-containing ribonuclease [Planctomycetota bacterium]
AARKARGGISLQRGEVKLRCSGEGQPSEVVPIQETSAHRLVERLMVAANEAVAAWLAARGLPALYRVQDEPDPERVARLVEYAHNFGFETAFGSRITPRGLTAFEEQFQTSSVSPQVRTVLRRVLGRARYQPELAPHFGLASPGYLHFTSPIRRYADLVVHRVVKAHLSGARDRSATDPAHAALAVHINAAASRARRAETERLRQLLARFYADRLGERCTGHVVSIKARGLIVQLDGLGASGLLPTDVLPGGPYTFDRDHEELQAKEGTGRFVVGQALHVAIASTDEDAGSLELELVNDA